MKTKLGTVKLLQGQNYGSYTSIVKKTLPDLVKSAEPVPYILISGTHLPWKGASNNPAQPLFYVGNTKDWIKWTKASKTLTLKDYSYGTCKVAMQGDKAQIRLVSEKGQLTNPMPFKPLGKIFEKMKPKMFFTVVDGWEAAPVTTKGVKPAPVGKEDPKATAINQKFAPKATTDRQQFEAAIDGIHTPKELDAAIKGLVLQAKQWEAVLKKNKQQETNALKEFKAYLATAQKEWAQVRPLYEDWLKKQKILEEKGFTEERFKALEEANAKIQALT
ncbi:MAG: hypothetical protein AB8E82_05970 [Aureispira sp.]